MHPKTTVLTVLRSGGEYTEEHVDRLRVQVGSQARFLCIRDADMLYKFPGWWAKMEAFSLRGSILYMDLDTHIVGDLTPLLDAACEHEFIGLRDFYRPSQLQSSLMAWNDDMWFLLQEFRRDPEGNMARCQTAKRWGDQGFIDPLTPLRSHWQDILPGAVVSWKVDCKHGIPDGAAVVCFHGQPRPWDVGL